MNGDITAIAPRIAQFVRLLGSNQDGEVLACVAALKRTLSNAGLDLNDLATKIEERPAQRTVFLDSFGWKTKPPIDMPPLFECLKRSARLEWLNHAAASNLLNDAERGLIVMLRAQVHSQPHKTVTPKQCAAISAALGKLWLVGVRV